MIKPQANKNFIIKLIISIAFLIIVAKSIDFHLLLQSLTGYPFTYFIAAFICAILVNVVGTFSLSAIYKKASIIQIFIVTLKSNYYAMFLPGQLLGESTKIFMLSSVDASLSERTSSVVMDKVLNLIAMILVGGIGICFTKQTSLQQIKGWFVLCFAISILAVLCAKNSKIISLIRCGLLKLFKKEKIRQYIINFSTIWLEYSNKNKQLLISALWGIIYQVLIAFTYFCLGLGAGIQVSFWEYCWINSLLTLILFLPISIGGLGVREVTLIGFLGVLGVDSEKAIVISVLLLLIQILRALVGGVLVLKKM